MKNLILFLFSTLFLIQCQKKPTEKKVTTQSKTDLSAKDDLRRETIDYHEFKADSIKNIDVSGFETFTTHQLNQFKIVTGYYNPVDGKIVPPDSENNNGRRLLVLDSQNKILFKSIGFGDIYLFEPHFFKNDHNDKIIIVFQIAYEYFMGAEAFLIDGNSIKYIGNMDIESNQMELPMTNVLKIKEADRKINFTFETDSLLLQPGSKDIFIRNNGTKYVYENSELNFYR
ncbi:hypothetical protein SAMN04488097_0532 [Epilithonimonas lactis]|nr:hypothetical protein SAMN04488097_0532 [Epilithonimonas lactis]